ncbi:glycosyltransferase [Bythopirellula polymerisocia]|uniref:MurG-like transferase n=1 Tax=Bythopirellula polymerisocia TaxID=2528003 RepID=A0A5C6CFB1_9BACT|nr:glycosyltransferase [Bythopirellula polymerisocia]TWU22695.1 MurG-like transferase [Bythopirellula polymerisocia]
MKFLITALGSYGDVFPMVGLGAALCGRGHQVVLVTNPHFQAIVEAAGIEFLPLGTAEEYDELAHHPDLWHPMRGPIMVLRKSFKNGLRELYDIVSANVTQGETILVAHCLDLASRIHHDKFGTPLASVHFAPVALRSFHQSPQMFGMLMQSWVPSTLRKFQFWLADKMVDHLVAGEVNALRGKLGLPPVRRVMHEWYFSPQLVLGMFPAWFAPPQPDWPPQTRLTGFPLWDQSVQENLQPDVEEFLQSGSPPIVFAPGSAMTRGEKIFAAAVDACQRLDRRGILLTRYPEQLPATLPESIKHCHFVPMSRLLPRCAALVQHGGIGTSAQGLAAGLPQIVMPMAYDQLDNATRLKNLDVAEILRPKRFTGANLAAGLDRLLGNSYVTKQCQHWAQQFDLPAAMNASCTELESLGGA